MNNFLITIDGEGMLEKLVTNSVLKATNNFNRRIAEEQERTYDGYCKTWVTIQYNNKEYRFRYDINKNYKRVKNLLGFMIEDNDKELKHIKNNLNKYTWLNYENYYNQYKEVNDFLTSIRLYKYGE